MSLAPTPSQTVGPFFSFALVDGFFPNELVPLGTSGAIRIRGQVIDGAGKPVPDAMVEIWQAASDAVPGGFARSGTDEDGWFEFVTVKPEAVDVPGHIENNARLQAPHLAVSVFARGLLKQAATRLYFPGEEANAEDPVLSGLDADARTGLIARPEGDGLRFDIRLQGHGQTTFFAL